MRQTGYFIFYLFFSVLISAAIAGLYLFLFITGYFPHVGVTVWIAMGISALLFGINIAQLPSLRTPPHLNSPIPEETAFRGKKIHRIWMSSIIGEIAVIGFGMMALGGLLSAAAQSTLVLVYLSALFFAFELLQLAAYAWVKLKQ